MIVGVELPAAIGIPPEARGQGVDGLALAGEIRHHRRNLDLLPLNRRHPRYALVGVREELGARPLARPEPRQRELSPRLALHDGVVPRRRHFEAHPGGYDAPTLHVERVRADQHRLELRVPVHALGDLRERLARLDDVGERARVAGHGGGREGERKTRCSVSAHVSPCPFRRSPGRLRRLSARAPRRSSRHRSFASRPVR